jgi:hypothetical protein
MGQHERHDKHARPENKNVPGLAQIEAADATDKQIADDEIKETPRDIDYRGGQAFPGRRCKRTLEGMPRDSIAEMGQSIREKRASEEVR